MKKASEIAQVGREWLKWQVKKLEDYNVQN
jgi:hypothetical protein